MLVTRCGGHVDKGPERASMTQVQSLDFDFVLRQGQASQGAA